MANQRSPDGRLVYLYCSSIFSGANAQVRKTKKISQLLQKHKTSIKILVKEFTLPAIAAVAKELLEEHIFESLPRARLRYPELFQPSETREAERAASEAEVLRIEAEAAQDIVLTSDDDAEDECLDFEQGERRAQSEGPSKNEVKASEIVQASAVQLCALPTPQAHGALSIPRLHPVYLPFKLQHNVLVFVQHMLEECCFEFGNTWVPDLMEARKWHEVESVELTQWTQRVLKYVKSLPPSAINPIAGKSIAEVLLGTSTLRHSAVHRHPTSAAGIVNMLSAAITFAEALNDSRRAKKIAEIKIQLEASIEEIVQHQNLLERKLTDQLEEVARRRAELDELERSSIGDMLAVDKKQRVEVGAAIESVIVGSHKVCNSCACNCAPSFEGLRADSEAGENIKSTGFDHKLKPSEVAEKVLTHDQEKNNKYGEELEENGSPPHNGKSESGAQEALRVLELVSPIVRPKVENKDGKKAMLSGQVFPPAAGGPVVDEAPNIDALRTPERVFYETSRGCPRKGVWNLGVTNNIPAEPHNVAEEATPVEKCHLAAPEGVTCGEERYIKLEEEHFSEDTFPVKEAVSKEDKMEKRKIASEVTLEVPQVKPITEGFDDVKEQTLNEYNKSARGLEKVFIPKQGSDVTPTHIYHTKDAEFLLLPPRSAFSGVHRKVASRSPPPPAPSSAVPYVLEAAAPNTPTQDGHAITLQILDGSKVLRSIVSVKACTRTAILNEARAYCMKRVQDDQSLGRLLAKEWDLALVSLDLDGHDIDMSSYEVENLSFLIETVGKTDIPRFTLRVFEI